MDILGALYMLGIVALSGYALYLVVSLTVHGVRSLSARRKKTQE